MTKGHNKAQVKVPLHVSVVLMAAEFFTAWVTVSFASTAYRIVFITTN